MPEAPVNSIHGLEEGARCVQLLCHWNLESFAAFEGFDEVVGPFHKILGGRVCKDTIELHRSLFLIKPDARSDSVSKSLKLSTKRGDASDGIQEIDADGIAKLSVTLNNPVVKFLVHPPSLPCLCQKNAPLLKLLS